MIELAAIFTLLAICCVGFLVLAAIWLTVKLAFKIVLLPLTLAVGLLKVVGVIVLGVLALVVAPVLLTVVAALLVPFLILAAIVGFGFAVVSLAA